MSFHFKRSVKNLVKNYSEYEVKVREATSNDPWGPSGTQMSLISDMTYNVTALPQIMGIIWKRLIDEGKNWRHVYKALVLLDYLIKTGSERVLLYCRANAKLIQEMQHFKFVDKEGHDQGFNIREKTVQIMHLLDNEESLKEQRERSLKAKEMLHTSRQGSQPYARTPPPVPKWASTPPKLPEMDEALGRKPEKSSPHVSPRVPPRSPGSVGSNLQSGLTLSPPLTTTSPTVQMRAPPAIPSRDKPNLNAEPKFHKGSFPVKFSDEDMVRQSIDKPVSKAPNAFEDAFKQTSTSFPSKQAQTSNLTHIDPFSPESSKPAFKVDDLAVPSKSAALPVKSANAVPVSGGNFSDIHSEVFQSIFKSVNALSRSNVPPQAQDPFKESSPLLSLHDFSTELDSMTFHPVSPAPISAPLMNPSCDLTSPVPTALINPAFTVSPISRAQQEVSSRSSPFASFLDARLDNLTFQPVSPAPTQSAPISTAASVFEPVPNRPVTDHTSSASRSKQTTPEDFLGTASSLVNWDNLFTPRSLPTDTSPANPFLTSFGNEPQSQFESSATLTYAISPLFQSVSPNINPVASPTPLFQDIPPNTNLIASPTLLFQNIPPSTNQVASPTPLLQNVPLNTNLASPSYFTSSLPSSPTTMNIFGSPSPDGSQTNAPDPKTNPFL